MKVVFGAMPILEATEVVTGETFIVEQAARAFQYIIRTDPVTGGEAHVALEVSLNGVDFIQQSAVSINTPGPDANNVFQHGYTSAAAWRYVRARVTHITPGTEVTVYCGV